MIRDFSEVVGIDDSRFRNSSWHNDEGAVGDSHVTGNGAAARVPFNSEDRDHWRLGVFGLAAPDEMSDDFVELLFIPNTCPLRPLFLTKVQQPITLFRQDGKNSPMHPRHR